MNDQLISAIRQKLQTAQRILIASHVRPDGDAIGSMLGLGLALQETGKDVQMVSSDGVPSSFRHLAGSDRVVNHAKGIFDLVAVVDCSDLLRVGDALNGSLQSRAATAQVIPDINIDHHVTNLDFAEYNLVEAEASATSEILANTLPALGFPISEPVASALLTGIITDTLGFHTSNVTPATMRTVADLMERGANLATLYKEALLQHSYDAINYWGKGLSKLQRRGSIVWTTLTLEDRKNAHYPGNDDADLINVLSSINEAEVSLIFVEQADGVVKVSWRAKPGIDVSQVALAFGGGGHKAASGANITGNMEEVQEKVISATKDILKSNI